MRFFKIKIGAVSNKSWGSIDKSVIWQQLKAGLQEGAENAAEAVREMYAVVKADINKDLTQADCYGPHHEIQQDGNLILSRGGAISAVAALRGARAEPDLTAEQKAQAEAHLKRHYAELDLPWPEGEIAAIIANITGEIAVEDVPLSPGVDLAALKADDDNPLEVVVEIPAGKSRRGWHYTPKVIQKIASEVNTKTVAGFLGHQKPDDVDYQFPAPVTHWVGALYRDGKAYVRGVVDKAAGDLKRWIRAGRIKQISVYGIMTTEQAKSETQVIDIDLLSIDWTPLDRAGMATRVVAVGEMDSIVSPGNQNGGVKQMTLAEILAELKKLGVSAKQLFGEMGWKIEDVAKEVAGETWVGLQAAVKAVGEIAGLFGLKDVKTDDVIKAVKDLKNTSDANEKTIGEIAQLFSVSKDAKADDLITAMKVAREAQTKAVAAEQEKLVDKVIGEMVVAEAARPLVKMMLQVPAGVDEAAIKKTVGEMLEKDGVKTALAEVFKGVVITPKIGREESNTSNIRVKRVAI